MGRRGRGRGSAAEVDGGGPRRRRVEREAPGAILRGPPIAVTCECGAKKDLAYGETWTCEECGRRWNTEQIPAEEYRALSDAIKRYQRQSILFAAVMLAIFIPLVVLVDVRLGVTGLILFFAWAFLVRPRMRRRLLDKVRSGPRWQLSPE